MAQHSGRRSVGILTFHRCINYGSYWQARCLAEGLTTLGMDAVLLEHRSSRVDRAEWRCALQPLLPVPTPREDHPLYKSKIRKFFHAFSTLPLSLPFLLDDPPGTQDFDLVVVGSDEVWNLKHPWYGGHPLFYGEGLGSGRLASYAASFGNLGSSEGLQGYWAERLLNFSNISVRDLNSARFIRDLLGFEPEIVLDPCLQFPQAIAVRGAEAAPPYVAVYGHSFPEWFQRAVSQWAAERGLPLASIGYRNDWTDRQWIDAGPEDFARFIANAGAVVTNFFHGCVFSLANEKPFACVLSDYRSNKLRDLTALAGAENHVIGEADALPRLRAALNEPLDSRVPERITAMRRKSEAYLRHVLQ